MSDRAFIGRYAGMAVLLLALAGCGGDDTGSAANDTSDTAPAVTERAYGAIDTERLMKAAAEPGNWFTTGRDFGKSHYSPLRKINRDTVGMLGFAWEYETFTNRGFEATPIVVDGVMYTSGVAGRVYALDAKTGEEIWFYDPMSDGQANRYACCDSVNRGVAVWEGMVYVGAFDGHLIALDAKTGEEVWKQDTIVDKSRAYSSSGAPEIAGDVVVIGNAGADFDARGYISAYDLKTGEFKWRFYTVPRDPKLGQEHEELEMAAETWDPNSRWDVGGGGTVWDGMVYDPELNLLYVGTGNAALFNWHERSPSGGDNLFLTSILAINPDTGRLVWYYQETPHDMWDYTAVQPMILTDLEWEGRTRKVLMQAPKNGLFYIIDRETGEVLSADPFVPVNWTSGVDLETGKPKMNMDQVGYSYQNPKLVAPSAMGGHNWHPMAYSPDTGLVYIPAIEGAMIITDNTQGQDYRPTQPNSGAFNLWGDTMTLDPERFPGKIGELLTEARAKGWDKSRAVLKAFDPKTGETVWEQESVGWYDRSGVLATGGGLVFKGTDEGDFYAYDDRTGKELLKIHVGTSIMAAPMTYTVDGEQYVAVMAAWGGGGWFQPHETSAAYKYGNEGRIIAFKLGGGAVPVPDPLPPIQPVPKPPVENTGTAEEIAHGAQLWRNCAACHTNMPRTLSADLLRMSADTHAQFNDIVLRGARRDRMMPQWDDILSEQDANDIHAYLIDQAWKAYEKGQEEEQIRTTVH